MAPCVPAYMALHGPGWPPVIGVTSISGEFSGHVFFQQFVVNLISYFQDNFFHGGAQILYEACLQESVVPK